MASFNLIVLIGNLTRDVKISFTPSQVAVGQFGIAVNKHYTVNGEKREQVLFIDCVIYKEQAQTLAKYVSKGSPLMITGEILLDTWEKEGQKRSKHTVLVKQFQFLPSGEKKQSEGTQEPSNKTEGPF